MKFYVGLHHPQDAWRFERCMVSVNQLRERKADFYPREWLMDSGAFTEVARHGGYRAAPEEYVEHITRWARCGGLAAAVSQDFMCEPFVIQRTGLTVREHQLATIERYVRIVRAPRLRTYVMPVLQGWEPVDYVRHVRHYGKLLQPGQWVGVGSVCKRNSKPELIEAVLGAIHRERSDLRLHGFGVKLTALQSPFVRRHLYSADSMAWSFAARYEGRNANSPHEAARYVRRVERICR